MSWHMQLDHVVLSGIMHSIPTTGFHLKRWGSLFREDSSNWIPLERGALSLAFVRQNAVGLANGWAGRIERVAGHGVVMTDGIL
ncbi:MAG: hypothetical protein GY777_29565 [Candidatus Brocadiaceae bacterium]|nr:hypothetical protein [Candidatus Brocadiaceae bacterium]